MTDLFTLDDLVDVVERAENDGDFRAGAAELVAAVDGGRLADQRHEVPALGLAAQLLDAAGDPTAALALAERAVEAAGGHGVDADLPRMSRAKLLFLVDRADEAMAELTALRPLLTQDPDAAENITDALVAGGRAELAHEWLSAAVHEARDAGEVTEVLHALLTERHHLRHDLDLPHDSFDEMAEELDEAIEEEERLRASEPVVFFTRDEFAGLPEEVAAGYGTWDEHRADVERTMAERSAEGITAGLWLLENSADAAGRPWPPARNDACWCGSGAKYKKCCLPRSRD